MSNIYSYKDFGDFLECDGDTKSIIFPNESGVLKTNMININEDIIIHKNSFQIEKDTQIKYDFTLNGLTINIALEANFLFQSDISDFNNHQISNNTIISVVNEEKGYVSYQANSHLKNIIIFVKYDFLKRVLKDNYSSQNIIEHIKNKKESKTLKSTQTNLQTRLCANEIYNTACETKLDNIYIQSKVLEILFIEFRDLIDINKKDKIQNIIFDEYDKQALEKAKILLVNDLKNPPNLTELSKLIGLNEFKLKYGFKKLFNITPYNFLLEHKLFYAKKLLETGEMNVSEIALEIGYKQVHGFSNAFFKRFGVRPKDIMKSRKYYF